MKFCTCNSFNSPLNQKNIIYYSFHMVGLISHSLGQRVNQNYAPQYVSQTINMSVKGLEALIRLIPYTNAVHGLI